jgi:ATP-dependent helicase HrpB
MPPLPNLPVTDALPALTAALAAGRNTVLIAPPGAGKTTLVPLALIDARWRGDGRILVLEPRRLATRAAAARMASLLGEQVGQTVGYRTRLDAAVSPATRIEVITEGLLIRRLLSDPGLDGVAAVLLDEVHERSLESDLALALCRDLQRELRPELRLLAMSATVDATRLAALLEADVIESAGRMFPVTITHATRDITQPRDLPDALARVVRAALAEHAGDILAFLPGMAEIRRTQSALDGCGALVLPLHGDLPPAEQDRALGPAEGRRVVLATSIAETSLTVPGVRVVVDGGWRRAPRLDQSTGLTRLATLRISRAAAEQRAGRAGREAPGVAIRLWTPALHRGLAAFDRPEMLEAELSSLVLTCAAWGTPPAALVFLDPPPPGALAAAEALLCELGALDATRGGATRDGATRDGATRDGATRDGATRDGATRDGASKITETGRSMARLGAHPRLAAMLLAAETDAEAALAAALAALLEERDPLRGSPLRGLPRAPDASVDISVRIAAIADGDPAADRGALSRIRQAASQYRRRLHLPADTHPAGDPGRLLAAAFPDRIAQRRGEPGSFRLSGGGGASLPRTDKLANAKLLVVATLEMRASAQIRMAAPLDPDALPAALAARVIETTETGFDPVSGSVLARRRRRLGTLVLSDRTLPADPAETAIALAGAVAAAALRPLPWTEVTNQLRARIGLLRRLEPGSDWPDLSDEALIAAPDSWLAPHLVGISRLADLARLDLVAVLRGMLPWKLALRLDQELPEHLPLPGGRASVDYTQDPPLASARAQAFFGLDRSPTLAGNRVRPALALLSPAGRPIAITGDLAGFWRGGWADARRDMRGRYPKHPWPDNPALAPVP